MKPGRLGLSLIVLVMWMLIPSLHGIFWRQGQESLIDLVSGGVLWPVAIRCAFLLLVSSAMRWNDIGFVRPVPAFRLRLLWLPMLYILLLLGGAAAMGFPSAVVIGIVALNMCLVGLNEEQMFRGVLLQGLMTRVPVWPAILISSVLFGAVHILNVFVTGDLGQAVLQCFGAGVLGLLFCAIRLRSGSLFPVIILHALWNFAIVMLALSAGQTSGAPVPFSWSAALVAGAVYLPIPVYALYLLRGIGSARRA